MINDESLEERLKRYRPAGPPSGLRARVLDRRQTATPLREWLPAAVAAAAIVVFSLLSLNARKELAASMTVVTEQRERRVTALATALGGGVFAEMEAERLIYAEGERTIDSQ